MNARLISQNVNQSSYLNITPDTKNHERSHISSKSNYCQPVTAIFFASLIMMTSILMPELGLSSANKLSEEFSAEEKARHAAELFELGDRLTEEKDYDAALAAYEQIFVFDPANTKASAKIDLLRREMKKERKDESGIVRSVYEQEAQEKVRAYWSEVQTHLKNHKFGQARLGLEKILILDPMNEEAQKLYEQLKQPTAVSTDETGKTL